MKLVDVIQEAKSSGDPGAISRAIPYANFIGIDAYLDGGTVICTMAGSDANVGNPVLPAIHGGVIGAFLEHTALMMLLWELAPGQVPRTVNVSIDYLRSSRKEVTYAKGVVTRQGRRVVNVRVEAWQADPSKLVATAHGHFLIAP